MASPQELVALLNSKADEAQAVIVATGQDEFSYHGGVRDAFLNAVSLVEPVATVAVQLAEAMPDPDALDSIATVLEDPVLDGPDLSGEAEDLRGMSIPAREALDALVQL